MSKYQKIIYHQIPMEEIMKQANSSSEQDELKRLTNRCIAIILTELGLNQELQADRPTISVIKNSIRKFEYNIRKDIMHEELSYDTTTQSIR